MNPIAIFIAGMGTGMAAWIVLDAVSRKIMKRIEDSMDSEEFGFDQSNALCVFAWRIQKEQDEAR